MVITLLKKYAWKELLFNLDNYFGYSCIDLVDHLDSGIDSITDEQAKDLIENLGKKSTIFNHVRSETQTGFDTSWTTQDGHIFDNESNRLKSSIIHPDRISIKEENKNEITIQVTLDY